MAVSLLGVDEIRQNVNFEMERRGKFTERETQTQKPKQVESSKDNDGGGNSNSCLSLWST